MLHLKLLSILIVYTHEDTKYNNDDAKAANFIARSSFRLANRCLLHDRVVG